MLFKPEPGYTQEQIEQFNIAHRILNTMSIACFKLGRQGEILYVNKKALDLFAFQNNNLIGKKLWEVLQEWKSTQCYDALHNAIHEREESVHECFSPVIDKWLYATTVPDDDGAVILIQEAEEIRAKNQELVKMLIESDAIAIFLFRAIYDDNNEIIDFECVLTNTLSEQIHNSQSLIGKRFSEIYPNPMRSWLFTKCKQVVLEGQRQVFEAYYNDEYANGWFRNVALKLNDNVVVTIEDISDQRKTEQELKESKELLQSVFDTSLIGLSVLQAVRDDKGEIQDFRILIINHQLEYETGRKDLVGKLYAQEYPGIKEVGIFDLMLQVMNTGVAAGMEYQYPYEGFDKWFACTFVKTGDCLLASNMDITKNKRAEQEKGKTLLLLQQAEELAGMGSWDYDVLADELTWSEGMYSLFNLEKGTVVKPEIYLQYATKKYRDAARRIIYYLKTGTKSFEETLGILIGGKVKYTKLKAEVIYNSEGLPVRVLGVDVDATAMHLAQEQIKEDNALIKGIADAAPDMLYVIDVQSMRMVYMNDKITRLFKKTEDEIKALGPKLFDTVVYPQDRVLFDKNIEELKKAADNEIKELTYRLVDAKGALHWIKTRRTIFKRDDRGRVTHVISVSQDITKQMELRKRNWQLKREQKEMEERQQQEIFRATLSTQEEERKRIAESLHNGLGQILYGVKLSLDQIDLSDPGKQKYNKESLHQTINLLGDAIKESRRISHELTPTILEDFGLEAAIQDICQQFGRSMDFKCDLTGLNFKLDKYTEIAVYRMLQELVLNIAKHAKATEGSITVSTANNLVEMTVNDNGQGFETDNSKIRGIGLKTIKNKVKLLKGSLHIQSARGQGTTIKITIPNI